MEQFVPRISEGYIGPGGQIMDVSIPIWYDDYELDNGSFVAYERNGERFAMYLDRMDDDVFRRVYVRKYDRNMLGRLPEDLYDASEWIYDAHFMDTQDDFQYGKYSIIDLDDEGLAKTMYVLMAGNDQFRKSSEQKFDVAKEEDLAEILDSVGLDVKIEETIRKTGRKTWTVYSEKGRRLGSSHSLSGAKRRLKQVEYFKHLNEGKAWTADEIRHIADEAGIDLSQYDIEEIMLGMPIELEHGKKSQPDANVTNDDPTMTLQIVLAHLKEFEKYYSEMLIPGEESMKKRMNEAQEKESDNTVVDDEAKGKIRELLAKYDGKQVPDPEVHALADRLGINTHAIESYIYNLASKEVSQHVDENFGMRVPLFEDFSDQEFRQSDWYIGSSGGAYASDGRAVRDFDYDASGAQTAQEDTDNIEPYAEVIRGAYRLFKNMTSPRRNGDVVMFGFSGPRIKNGPYAGSDSWWTFGYDYSTKKHFLVNDTTGQAYEVADTTDFRKMMSELIHDLYESVHENENDCPACGKPRVVTCKCAGFVKHDFDALQRGHGLMCENRHRWSRQTADGKPIILL